MSGVRVRFLNRNEILPRLTALTRQLLASRTDVLEVSLFGSLVRGNYAPGSDADIYILLRDDSRRFIDRIPEFLDHFSGVGLPVEVFPYTVEEVKKMKDSGFIKTFQRDKMVLALCDSHMPG
jgi:predicted nucleotidyltransferase